LGASVQGGLKDAWGAVKPYAAPIAMAAGGVAAAQAVPAAVSAAKGGYEKAMEPYKGDPNKPPPVPIY
jgi:hypothetical protein